MRLGFSVLATGRMYIIQIRLVKSSFFEFEKILVFKAF